MLDSMMSGNAAPAGDAPPQPGGRRASQQEQSMFDTMAHQALSMLTSEDGARELHRLAVTGGPDKAIAEMVGTVLDGVQQAAEGAGVEVPPDVRSAASRASAQVLAQLLVEGGVGDDPKAIAASAINLMEGGEAAEVPDGRDQ